ncbi:MAG: AzlD domain-containing protein [Bacillota bacterium]
MALVTYVTRASFLVLPDRLKVPKVVERALRYVPVGVLTALVVNGAAHSPLFLAGTLVSALVAYRTGNVLVATATGTALVSLLHWLVGM